MDLRLRRPERSDLDVLVDWMGDSEFRQFLFGDGEPKAQHMGQQMLGVLGNAMAAPMAPAGNLLLETPEHEPVGVVMLHELSWRNRTCFISLYLAPHQRGNDGVLHAVESVFRYCFEELNLHHAALRFDATQSEYEQACATLGAQRELQMPAHATRDGKPVDLIGYGMLRRELLKEAPAEVTS